ncbi:MAG TPA: MMPL family transporter, partial [Gammaproteobacteria bacterium]|nr:MMPL family transporter [Gammaproteobacteria bacterium]
MAYEKAVSKIESFAFRFRILIILAFAAVTIFMGYMATHTRIEAGFQKMVPLQHPYMQTYVKYRSEFGGANRILVSLYQKKGDMFNKTFFNELQEVTNAVFFIPGVERGHVKSIFTPNVRYVEVTEQGLKGGNVIPSNFSPSEQGFDHVRQNIIKSGQIGRLVTNDFHGAMVQAELLDRNPDTGKKIDYIKIAHELRHIREKYQTPNIRIHIIGFAMETGDIADATGAVMRFFAISFLVTALLLYLYSGSFKLTVLPLTTSATAVLWMFGILNLLGYAIDPMSILVPFLIFAIGVSHGVQMINGWMQDILEAGHTGLDAARGAFRRLLVPGSTALITDTLGFATIVLINIKMIQDTALIATIGVATIVLTNLFLLPLLLSFTKMRNLELFRERQRRRNDFGDRIWRRLSALTDRGPAVVALLIAVALLGFGLVEGQQVKIGDQKPGVPELRENSQYNKDARAIV